MANMLRDDQSLVVPASERRPDQASLIHAIVNMNRVGVTDDLSKAAQCPEAPERVGHAGESLHRIPRPHRPRLNAGQVWRRIGVACAPSDLACVVSRQPARYLLGYEFDAAAVGGEEVSDERDLQGFVLVAVRNPTAADEVILANSALAVMPGTYSCLLSVADSGVACCSGMQEWLIVAPPRQSGPL
jgi:hypothetical protein